MFTPEQIAKLTREGHWPPPPGAHIIDVTPTDPQQVEILARQISKNLSPKQRKVIENIFKL